MVKEINSSDGWPNKSWLKMSTLLHMEKELLKCHTITGLEQQPGISKLFTHLQMVNSSTGSKRLPISYYFP